MLPQEQTDHDDIKIKKLELLNSILMKELLESKDKITNLKEENEKLKVENLKLKNFRSTNDIDSHNKIERIKNEPLDIDSNEDNYQNPHKSTMDIIENTLNSTNKSTKNEENLSFQEEKENKSLKSDFSSMENQNPHEETMHNHTVHEVYKDYKCESCGKSFSDEQNLKKHKYLKCNIEKVHQRKNLEKHQYIHKVKKIQSKKISLQCSQCSDVYQVEKDLIQHIKMVHEGQKIQRKKTKCDVCETMLSNKYILASHIKVIHEGKCQYCDFIPQTADSNRSQLLKDHIENNHKTKKKICQHCGKYFVKPSNLVIHISAVHRGMKISCNSCDKSFSTPGSLKRHTNTVHNGIKDP